MKLKTLLLGSAAAMIAVSGARAADAVIAEPEPIDYVKVCDIYGTGFWYIPGTETCMSIDGYVRLDYTYTVSNGNNSDAAEYRARLNFDVRNETDWGTLRSQIRLQGTTATAAATGTAAATAATAVAAAAVVGIDRALISVGGLRMGYSDSYTTTLHGYGLPVEKNDGSYGYDQAIFIDYTIADNGFSATVGAQDSNGTDVLADYYVGASYSGSFGDLAASYIYETATTDGAWKVSATITAIENLTIKGFYVGDQNSRTATVAGNGNAAWGAGLGYNITDSFGINGGFSDASGMTNAFFVVGAQWDPIPGLSIRPEARFNLDGANTSAYNVRVYRTF